MLSADSSFLVSCYILDANTGTARAYLSGTKESIAWTPLHALEVRNALGLGVFCGLITPADLRAAWQNLQSDLKNNRLVRSQLVWPTAFRAATTLSRHYSARIGTRSLDILHIAAAKSLQLTKFVSFDQRQRRMAALVGLQAQPRITNRFPGTSADKWEKGARS
ncbi:MAG: type II toxin-antitoxin system VapC family toxin [Blastocatellia bacterium]